MGEKSFYLFAPTWFVFIVKRNESFDNCNLFDFHCNRFPFEWRTPFGYFVALLGQGAGSLFAAASVLQFLNLLFGSCWPFILIAVDITKDLEAFNNDVRTPSENLVNAKLTKCFCGLIQIYSDAKQ